MSQETVKKTECIKEMAEMKDHFANLERSLRRNFWAAVACIVVLSCGGFAFYYNQQEKKINRIAVASIKSDERLEKQIEAASARMRLIERQQAAIGAKIDANMKWLIESCTRIEAKQTLLEERLSRTP